MMPMRTIRTLFWFLFVSIIIGAGILFTWQNSKLFSVQFAYWSLPEYPIALLLLVVFVLGFLTAGFYFLIDIIRMKSQLRKATKNCKLLEKEIDALRNQPLYDEPNISKSTKSNLVDQHLTYEGQPEISIEQPMDRNHLS